MARSRYERPRPRRERRRLYVVATEGSKTEAIYFDQFNNDRFRKNVRVEILAKIGASSPEAALKRLQRYERENNLEPGDELWVVVDVDNWGPEALDRLCVECRRAGYQVAVSNPCFELWLVLHQEKPPKPLTTQSCHRALERLLGRYEKANYDVTKLMSYVDAAIRHASQLDQEEDPDTLWPHSTGTHVYKLVQKLVEKPEATAVTRDDERQRFRR